MLRFQPLIATGAGLVLILPTATLGQGDLSSLSAALRDTEHALNVVRGLESEARAVNGDAPAQPSNPIGPILRGLTEAPYGDGPTLDSDLERLRNEVGLLQVEFDSLDARTYGPAVSTNQAGTGPISIDTGAAGTTRPLDIGDPTAGSAGTTGNLDVPSFPGGDIVSTGLSAEQRAALSGVVMPSEATGENASTAATTNTANNTATGTQGAPEPRVATPSNEDPGYSADPLLHAQALYRIGRYKEGFALISTLTEPSAVYLQARFLEKLGRIDEAITALESIVDKLPAGYEARRAQSDLEFFQWKRDFLARLPEDATKPVAEDNQ